MATGNASDPLAGHRVRYGLDPALYFPDDAARRDRVAFMPRKNAADAE